jgi:hypothetical protein
MNLKNILFASFALSGIAAAGESFDENDLNARAPVCYCCSGFIVRNIAGTRCGSGEPAKLYNCAGSLLKRHELAVPATVLIFSAAQTVVLSGLRSSVYLLLFIHRSLPPGS